MSDSTSNLVPFRPGPDPRRNTKGRPRRQESILACMKRVLQTVGEDDSCPQENMVKRLVDAATSDPPSLAAARLLIEHCEGGPRQRVALEAAGPHGWPESLTAEELHEAGEKIEAFRKKRAELEAAYHDAKNQKQASP
jgi:hypothetical protein